MQYIKPIFLQQSTFTNTFSYVTHVEEKEGYSVINKYDPTLIFQNVQNYKLNCFNPLVYQGTMNLKL